MNNLETQIELGGLISENLPGFGESSEISGKVIFIGRGDGENVSHCWYILEGGKDKPIRRFIKADTLTGELTGITLSRQDSGKFGISTKVGFNLLVSDSTRYQIRTTLANARGEPSVFIRGLLSLLLKCQPGAITIGVQPSDEDAKIVFPKVIQNGKFVSMAGETWLPKDSDFEAAIASIANIFGVEVDDRRNVESKQEQKGHTNSDEDVLIRAKRWLFESLDKAGVPKTWQEATLRHVLGNPTLNAGKLTLVDIKRIRDEVGTDGASLKSAYDIVNKPVPAPADSWDGNEFPEEPEGGLFPGDEEQF